MNGERIFFSDQNLSSHGMVEGTNTHYEQLFKSFLHNFSRENTRVYHKRLETQIRNRKFVLPIQINDLKAFDDQLYERLSYTPLEILRVMEDSLRTYLIERKDQYPICNDQEWHVILRSDDNTIKIRDIKSNMISKLFVISGIIISSTKPYIKASKLKLQCKSCLNTKTIELSPGQNPYVPSFCEGIAGHNQKCPKDSFIAMPTSQVIDSQSLKIQEFPEDIPTGQVARTYHLVVDRKNVSLCVPGDRVRATGVMLASDMKSDNLHKGYLYVTGIQKIKERAEVNYTEEQQQVFKNMAKDPNLYQKICSSIAPGIFGNQQIKSAVASMLFGGSRKHLPDETVLRGDINVLLIGDPSTAKSQFLKFVEQAAPIAVYTSGKGSSAAGLTASITKDSNTGQFQIQGGALVLADGGIVCIDQFDKMKPNDRVAIHEAMEQQTISVAKAGITTRLNSRTSVLAAANPIFGRYDNFKQIQEQIELQSTILSRFDCIFIVKDINNDDANNRIAKHILDLHQGRISKQTDTDIPFEILKKYIKYAKSKVNPRLSATASDKLQEIYIEDRQKSRRQRQLKNSRNGIPITVRQLEAVIRLSESIAKMRLKPEVGLEQVEDAHYLFEISTMKTIEGSSQLGYNLSEADVESLTKIEELVRKKVCIGNQVSTSRLLDDLETSRFSKNLIEKALSNMIKNQEMKEVKGRKMFLRVR